MGQQQHNTPSNLAIRILSVMGGLLAAICLIIFLIVSDISRSETALSVIGISFIIAAIIGNRTINQLFLDTSITTLYVAGCIALCYAMSSSHWNIHIICLLFILIAALTFLFSKGFFLPFLAVLLFNIALTWFIMESVEKIEISQFIVLLMGTVFLSLNLFEARLVSAHSHMKQLFHPLHTGFFFSFIGGLIWISGIGYSFDKSVWMLSVFLWAGIVLIVRRAMIVMEVTSKNTQAFIYLACLAFLIPTLFAPFLSGALLLLLICFCYGYKVEMGISIVVFIYAVVKYYYDLQLTLLVKSGTLFFTGALLWLVWYFFTKHKKNHEKI